MRKKKFPPSDFPLPRSQLRPEGIEPPTKGLCIPLRLSTPFRFVVWTLSSQPKLCPPSSLCTFPFSEGLAQDYHAPKSEGFPEFDEFYRNAPATHFRRVHAKFV